MVNQSNIFNSMGRRNEFHKWNAHIYYLTIKMTGMLFRKLDNVHI